MTTSNLQPTIAAPPTTQVFTSQALATMAAESGVLTDYNFGSQIRTMTEAAGSVVEQEGVWVQAAAFQALLYGAMSLFSISPYPAFQANGSAYFTTSQSSGGPAATINVPIGSGTLMQTTGGVQFVTTSGVILASGASGISAPIIAVVGGLAGNVGSGAINQIISGLLYPLFVTNTAPTSGGTNAEQFSATLARFAAKVSSLGVASPQAIANSAVGVYYSGTGETVAYSTCFEPWLAAGSGIGSGTAGWILYVDNGAGTSSSGLIAAVNTYINGGALASGTQYRDAGVPYSIAAVVPTYATVGVSGTASSLTTDATVSGLIAAAVTSYFSLPFGASASQALLAQAVGTSVLGLMTSLTVSLYASGSSTAVSGLTTSASGRIVLGGIALNLN